ncbi:hypothetical protein MMC21_001825 [Puttea exsequens]|nr:hypothetical protein [Puttea exsequens]
MTNFEKATFDRIYKDIERSSPADDLDEVDEGSEKEIAAGVEWNSKANLESIFDAAIQRESETQKIKEVGKQRFIEEAPRTDARRFESPGFRTGMAQKVGPERVTDELLRYKNEPGSSREFRRPLRLANGAVFGEGMDTEEHRERVKKACDDHRKLVNGMYYRARTDLEIWKLLEREVFKMLEHLNKQIEMRENFESGKGTKTKGNKKKDRTTPIVSEKTRVTKTDESIAIPIDVLYAIISANYSNYLLSALRMLRRYHPSSPYCLALLPAVKRLGSISYVLAGNGAFYNELIFLRWTQYSDLHGIADLLEEMLDQGIKTNTITGMLMKRLRKEKRQAMLGRGGPVVKAWWSLRGTEEAWQRVTGAEWRIRRAEAEEDADRAKEGEERREHEREDWEGLLSRVTV